MGNGSIFDILRRRKEKMELSSYELKDDLTSKIEEELTERDGTVNDEEEYLVLDYLGDDYVLASSHAYDNIKKAQADDKNRLEYLAKAGRIISRAAMDVALARKILQKPVNDEAFTAYFGRSYAGLLQYIQNLKEELRVTYEYGKNASQINNLGISLRAAVKRENYELAASIREKMHELTAQ